MQTQRACEIVRFVRSISDEDVSAATRAFLGDERGLALAGVIRELMIGMFEVFGEEHVDGQTIEAVSYAVAAHMNHHHPVRQTFSVMAKKNASR